MLFVDLVNAITLICFIHSTESVTVASTNSLDGQFKFMVGSMATFTCTINPYKGVLKWFYDDNINVAGCAGSTCKDFNTYQGAFQFKYNTSNGNFTWIIMSVQYTNNDKVLKCNDGANNASFTLHVQEFTTPPPSSNKDDIIGGGIAGGGGGLLVIIVIVVFYYKKAKSPIQPAQFTGENFPQLRWQRGDNRGFRQTFIIRMKTRNGMFKSFKFKDTYKEFIEQTIPSLPQDNVCYDLELFAKNFKGESTKSELHVPGMSYPLTDFVATEVLNHSVLLTWKHSICRRCNQKQIYSITVNHQCISNETQRLFENKHHFERSFESGSQHYDEYPLRNLLSGIKYTAILTARNNGGNTAEVRSTCDFQTQNDPKPAKILKVEAETDRMVVRWEAEKDQILQSFIFQYKEKNTAKWQSLSTKHTFDSNVYTQDIINLKERTVYEIKIEAENVLGTVAANTEEETCGKPDPPENIKISAISDTQIRIQWSCGANGGFPQTFEIKEAKNSVEPITDIKDIDTLKIETVVEGLSPATYYEFMVGAKNCIDTSWSKKTPIKTLPTKT